MSHASKNSFVVDTTLSPLAKFHITAQAGTAGRSAEAAFASRKYRKPFFHGLAVDFLCGRDNDQTDVGATCPLQDHCGYPHIFNSPLVHEPITT